MVRGARGAGWCWPGGTRSPSLCPGLCPDTGVLGMAQARLGGVMLLPCWHWGCLGRLLLSSHLRPGPVGPGGAVGSWVTLSLHRGAEILYSLALAHARRAGADSRYPLSDYALLTNARRNLGLFQHHDAITGTAKEAVVVDYGVRCVRVAAAQPGGTAGGWWVRGWACQLCPSGVWGRCRGMLGGGRGHGPGCLTLPAAPGCCTPSRASNASSSTLRTTWCWGTRTPTATTLPPPSSAR